MNRLSRCSRWLVGCGLGMWLALGGAAEGQAPQTARGGLDPAELDRMIEQAVAQERAPVSQVTTDDEFLKRLSLDLVGRPPTAGELDAFRKSRSTGYRSRAIDRMLASSEFARNQARYWRDVIKYRATNDAAAQVRYDALEDWLADQFEANRPWDEVARELIGGTGENDKAGAVNFTLAHAAQPVELAGEVSRIFLGVQIQCAQCHDHPEDPWKRVQFHEFAAFFAGTRSRRVTPQGTRPEVHEVVAQGAARYAMPDLQDPKKTIAVEPRFFLGDQPALPRNLDAAKRRSLVAVLVTAKENRWFARAFVNRVCYQLLGDAFYTPIDDLGPARDPRCSEVIDRLAAQWQAGGYDVRWLYRTLLNTKAYQRQSRSTYSEAGRTLFASNVASRLRPDQIHRSLQHALSAPGGDQAKGAAPLPNLATLEKTFGFDPSTLNEEVLSSIPQALFLMNSPQIERALKADAARLLGKLLASSRDDALVTKNLYVHVLARQPTSAELTVVARYLTFVGKGKRKEAFEDLFWSLLNSTEFLSRR